MLKSFLPALLAVLALSVAAAAQEVEVDRYTVSARIDMAANAIDARASLAITNLGRSPKSRIYLRLTKLAKVSSVSVGGSPAEFESSDDRRVTTLNQVVVSPRTPVEAGGKATLDVSYRIEVPESTPLAAIYPGEVLMLPESVWVPMPSTMFTIHGAATAPFTLTVSTPAGYGAASSGALNADASGLSFTFDQSLNSLPFIIAGRMDHIPDAQGANGVKIEFHLQSGLVASNDWLRPMYDEAARMIDFYTKTLGPLPAGTTFRIISSARAGNILVPGAIVLDQQVFRQESLDAIMVERLADAIARMWIGGRSRLRGEEARAAQGGQPAQKARSAALLGESLPRFLAVLYIEERFGKDAAMDAFTRQRWSYTPVAKSARDAELGIQTPLVPSYSAAAFGKGPLVFRLIAETAGREKFIAALREVFSGAQSKIVTTDDLRQSLVKASGSEIDRIFQQWVESIIEPDLVVGIPLPAEKPGTQRLNLRNLGTGEVKTEVLAVAASGKQMTLPVTVPSEDITSIEVPTAEKIDSVEVDPRKLIVQTDYDNDRKPARVSSQTLFNESIAAFNKGEHAVAEAKLKEALANDPRNELLHAWLARALFARNNLDAAQAAATAAIKSDLPAAGALAWAHITLGQVALARNQSADAVGHLRRAVIVADEAPAQFAARELLVRALRAANMAPQVDGPIRAFVSQLDSLIKQPASDKLFEIVNRNNLKRFVQGLTVSPPTSWTTEIQRVDPIDANRVAMDVGLTVKTKQADQSGTAVFVLYRAESGWVLEDVQLFNVK